MPEFCRTSNFSWFSPANLGRFLRCQKMWNRQPCPALRQGVVDRQELRCLEEAWKQLERVTWNTSCVPAAGQIEDVRKSVANWLRWGIAVRDAWIRVFEEHDIVSCLSADDSNPYTRIPLLLAEQRHIPAVAVHHGALDCFMAFKELRFSDYIAKGEMERDYLERICRSPRRSHSRRRCVDARSE